MIQKIVFRIYFLLNVFFKDNKEITNKMSSIKERESESKYH